MSWLRRFLAASALAWPVLMGLVLGVRHFLGETSWWSWLIWTIPTLIWVILSALIFALAWACRPKQLRLPRPLLGCTVVSLLLAVMLLDPHLRSLPVPGVEALKVMQLNMEHGLEGSKKVAELIEQELPDVLFLEEAGPLGEPPERMVPELARALSPYEVHRGRFEAIAVKGKLSEKEIIDIPEMLYERDSFGGKVLTVARAYVGGHRLILVALHFSPAHAPFDRTFFGHMQRLLDVRAKQFAALRALIEAHPHDSMIIGGDFNAHPAGPEYRRMAALATDAFAATGLGCGFTLTAKFPVKRIDYIWCRNAQPVRCEVLPDVVSDHRAVVAWINSPMD